MPGAEAKRKPNRPGAQPEDEELLVDMLLKNRLALIVNIALSVICGMVASGASGVFTVSMFSVMLPPPA